jgi:hypothetical protein
LENAFYIKPNVKENTKKWESSTFA